MMTTDASSFRWPARDVAEVAETAGLDSLHHLGPRVVNRAGLVRPPSASYRLLRWVAAVQALKQMLLQS